MTCEVCGWYNPCPSCNSWLCIRCGSNLRKGGDALVTIVATFISTILTAVLAISITQAVSGW